MSGLPFNKVCDGYDVISWPELRAFFKAIKVEVPEADNVEFSLVEGEIVTVKTELGDFSSRNDGYGAYRLPEFQRLCERLGVNWRLYTVKISFYFKEGELPKVFQEYVPVDTTKLK